MRLIDADALKESIDEHVYLVHHGFNETEYGCTQYGIHQIIDDAPTIDAIPIEFIQKRIDQLKEINERLFMVNGGYTSPSDYEQWELERLIRDWRERND